MKSSLYRITQTGLGWYCKNRVLNRKRTSSQKYSRCIWEVVLGTLVLSACDAKTLFETFLVDGHSPWYDEKEVVEQLALLLEMGYVTLAPAPELDKICGERTTREAKIISDCGRDWKKRNERMRLVENDIFIKLNDWFRLHPDWPV